MKNAVELLEQQISELQVIIDKIKDQQMTSTQKFNCICCRIGDVIKLDSTLNLNPFIFLSEYLFEIVTSHKKLPTTIYGKKIYVVKNIDDNKFIYDDCEYTVDFKHNYITKK